MARGLKIMMAAALAAGAVMPVHAGQVDYYDSNPQGATPTFQVPVSNPLAQLAQMNGLTNLGNMDLGAMLGALLEGKFELNSEFFGKLASGVITSAMEKALGNLMGTQMDLAGLGFNIGGDGVLNSSFGIQGGMPGGGLSFGGDLASNLGKAIGGALAGGIQDAIGGGGGGGGGSNTASNNFGGYNGTDVSSLGGPSLSATAPIDKTSDNYRAGLQDVAFGGGLDPQFLMNGGQFDRNYYCGYQEGLGNTNDPQCVDRGSTTI